MLRDERIPIILGYTKGKDVLDIGCVDHEASKENSDEWLHKKICDTAKSVLGLDNNEKEAKKLQPRYNIVCANAQTVDLGRKFDCIVAGELLEHLENPGIFLENMKRHLRTGGCIILTTPNPFYPVNFFHILMRRSPCPNPEHTCWFCDMTIYQLLKRAGFDNINIYFTNKSKHIWGRLPCKVLKNGRLASNIVAVASKNS